MKPRAYYNENDKFAAAWLRELIKKGLIADGDVDERSIEDVQPDDLRGYTQCHFFAGIGVWSYALRRAGWADDVRVWTGSCPCQSFSASGKRGGFSDKRHLWPAWFRLIRECRPDELFGEQVASKDGLAWLDIVSSDMEAAGYTFGAADMCAASVGAPHIRQRLYFVGNTGGAGRGARRPSGNGIEESAGRDAAERSLHRNDSDSSSIAGQLADTAGDGHATADGLRTETESPVASGAQRKRESAGSGDSSRLADSETTERGRSGSQGDGGRRSSEARGSSVTGGMEDSKRSASSRYGQHSGTRVCQQEASGLSGPSYTSGFWRDAEWLYCRDEKYRPVEPGTFPLASGATNRVGRLRGYGNAINAEVAKEFIAAYLEVANDPA